MHLYVTKANLQLGDGNKLAVARSCCCKEQGAPEDCYCPDFCLYDVIVVEPSLMRVPPNYCYGHFDQPADQLLCLDFDLIYLPNNKYGKCWAGQVVGRSPRSSYASWFASNALSGLAGDLSGQRIPNTDDLWAGITYAATVTLFCETYRGPNLEVLYKLMIDIVWSAWVTVFERRSPTDLGAVVGEREIHRSLRTDFPFECIKKPGAFCENFGDGFDSVNFLRRYATGLPLDITVSYESAGFGAWGAGSRDIQSGDQTRVSEYINNIIDNFTPRFVVLQRKECRPAGCNCGTNLAGLKATFDEGKEFTLGTPHTIEEGNTRWQHEVDAAGSYSFYRDTFLPENLDCGIPSFSIPIELITLTLYCVKDFSADPPIERWMVEVTTTCTPTNVVDCEMVPTGFAQRLFYGRMNCAEAISECVGPAGGAYIPDGSPVDIFEAEDSPFLNGDLPDCGAPHFPNFRIEQNCSA